MVNHGEKFDDRGCPNRWRWEWISEEVEIRKGESVLKERVGRRLCKIDVKGQAWCLLCECTVSYVSRGLRNLTDRFQRSTSKRTEKEKLLEEEIVETPPTSRRVNPQKRVLEKTRQKSVGPAEKRQKLTVTVVAEIHHSEEQQVPSQQQPEREAVESVDTCISKSRLTSKPKQSTLTTFFQKHV